MKRVGFATGYDPAMGVRDMAKLARYAEESGYEIAFFSETQILMRDGVSAMAAFAVATERITLGFTQVARLRSPVVIAQTLATLDELSGGRIVLSPGACIDLHAKKHSLDELDPPGTLRESMEVMRLILTGEKISYQGKYLKLDNVGLSWQPCRKDIPFWVAATSRTGLRLAGQVADGVLLNAITSPEYSANAVKFLKEVVEKAGRDWDKFEVAQLINCSVEDHHKNAIDAIRWEVASKFNPAAFSQLGPRLRVGEPYINMADVPLIEKAYKQGGMNEVIRSLPESWIEGMTASGTPEHVIERVQKYRDAGVRLPILRPAAKHQTERLMKLFASK
jgi:5,10-methylenetetrahydromethanopterin reductase